MKEIRLESWDEFDPTLHSLRSRTERPNDLLFRGHSDARWHLQTTLDRLRGPNSSLIEYYRVARSIKPRIETETGEQWEFPAANEIDTMCREYDALSLELSFGRLPAYSYLIYLRHHGFPSPLLDWTSSPYVAAYFAFAPRSPEYRAIYVYAEMPSGHGKSSSSKYPRICSFGPFVKSHRRHFLQQSQYTVCVRFDQDSKQYNFAPHDEVFDRQEHDQDLLAKIILPSSERIKALKLLDAYNLNAFSLFGSEESLAETLALREFDFR